MDTPATTEITATETNAPAGPGSFRALLIQGWPLAPLAEGPAGLERAAEWNSSLRPCNAFEVFLVDQIAGQSLNVERCQHHGRALRSLQGMRAVHRWDADRRLAAEELGAGLSRAPSRVAARLEHSRQGCDWKILRWEGLGRILEAKGDWDDAQRRLALDLLGTPAELREGPTALEGAPGGRREVVEAEIGRLRLVKAAGLDDLDAHERAAAELGIGPADAPLAALKREERTCSRRLEWAVGMLKKGRHEYIPGGPPRGGQAAPYSPIFTPTSTPTPAPGPGPVPPSKSEEGWREELRAARARIASRPTPPIEFARALATETEPTPVTAPMIQPEPAAPDPAETPAQPRAEAVRNHPSPSPAGRTHAPFLGERQAAGNRHDRRAHAAVARRQV